jgi:hypothetical protein
MACMLAAAILVFQVPQLLRLSGPFVCPSGYDHSEGYHFPEREGDQTTYERSVRCYGRDGEVLVERASGEPGMWILTFGFGALGLAVIQLVSWIGRRREHR